MKKITRTDYKALTEAKRLLERPGLTSRITEVLGKPIERGFEFLPEDWRDKVTEATRAALMKGLNLAVGTLGGTRKKRSQDSLHKLLVTASGAGSGALGLMALPFELPVSTCLMLRSIADIARSEGHDITWPETKLSCLEVFALGSRSSADDTADSAYWTVRAALATALKDAASLLAERGVLEKSAPAVLRLITAISSRFGVAVSEQLAAKAIPVVGAAGGSIINVLFMNHFQDMARGHFIIKRLEKNYGVQAVRGVYESLTIPV